MKILVTIVLTSMALTALSQGSIVTAPILEMEVAGTNALLESQAGQISSIGSTMQGIEKAEQAYKDAMKQSAWLRNLETARKILFMIENLVCTSRNLNVRMSLHGNSKCLYRYQFDLVIAKVQMSVDYLTIVLAGVSMTTAERMRTLNDVLQAFEEAQQKMVELNETLSMELNEKKLAGDIRAGFKNFSLYERKRKAVR